jgi:hypothetical protein
VTRSIKIDNVVKIYNGRVVDVAGKGAMKEIEPDSGTCSVFSPGTFIYIYRLDVNIWLQ